MAQRLYKSSVDYMDNLSQKEKIRHLKKKQWNSEQAFFILKQCLISRFLLFTIQFVFNILVRDYPTDAFKGIPPKEGEFSVFDHWLRLFLSGLARWDSVHFLHIAEYGYTFETSLAFFPFFPALIYFTTILWSWLVPIIHFTTALILTAVAINFVFYLICGQLLYCLLLSLTNSEKIALLSSLVFTINPASIFFSSVYTECTFMLFTLSGLLVLQSETFSFAFFRYIIAAFVFSIAYTVRSNGILNFIFIISCIFIETIYCKEEKKLLWQLNTMSAVFKVIRSAIILILCWLIFDCFIAIHAYQMHKHFCSVESLIKVPAAILDLAVNNSLIIPGQIHNLEWCRSSSYSFFRIMPAFYGSIQKKYWDVKWFGYWTAKKIPCFILASPTLFVVFCGIFEDFLYLSSFIRYPSLFFTNMSRGNAFRLPFALHASILCFSSIFLFNIEIITRIMFSCSPYIYLVIATYMDRRTPLVTIEDVQYPILLPFFTNFSRTHFLHAFFIDLFAWLFFYWHFISC